MRETELRSVLKKIEPSAALIAETKRTVRTSSGAEKSFRFNIRWFIPKAAVAVFALFAVFAVIGIVNRAPAIYGQEFVFANMADFEPAEIAAVPTVMSEKAKTVSDAADISDSFAAFVYKDVLGMCVEGTVTDASLYLYYGGNGLYGLCVYTVVASDIIEVNNVPDFITENTELTVVTYLTDPSQVTELLSDGEKAMMWLYTSESGYAVNDYGKLAGLQGVWELYDAVLKPDGKSLNQIEE